MQTHRFDEDIERQLRELTRLDDWHAPAGYLRDLAVIAGSAGLCLAVSWWFYPVALVLIASRQRAFSNLLHESAHGILTRGRRLNLLFGTVLTAYPIFQQHYAYKRNHVAMHHPRLGDPERDPDLRFAIEQGVYRPGSRRRLWWRLVILPALGSRIVARVRSQVGDWVVLRGRRRTPGLSEHWQVRMRRDRAALAGFWILVAVAAWQTGAASLVVLFWVVPYLTTFQVLGWYIELAEHTPMVRRSTLDIAMTRNRKSRSLERFLTGTYGDHYHLDHHLDPRTPFWNLAEAHRVRGADPEYARVDAAYGGLFTRGPAGQPSALAAIVHELAAAAAGEWG